MLVRVPQYLVLAIGIIIILGLIIVAFSPSVTIASEDQKKQITITAILDRVFISAVIMLPGNG